MSRISPRVRVVLFFLLLSGLWVLPQLQHLDQAPFHPSAQFSDLQVSHWPNTYFLKSEFARSGEIPLWNPQILSGAPLVADPLFSLWYPPNWIAYVLPIMPAFNLMFWLHLAFAGIGFTLLMRNEGLDWVSSTIAGIAFSGTPKLIGHIGLGHLTLLAAVAWSPWILLCVRRAIHFLSEERAGPQWAAMSGALLGLVFLIDPRWVIPLGILSTAYGIWLLANGELIKDILWPQRIKLGLWFVGVALGIAAVLALPLYEFISLSTRVDVTVAEASELSLPIISLLGLILPNFGGSPETLSYTGLSVLCFSTLAVIMKGRGWQFWSGTALVSLLLAFGDQLPIYPLFVRLIPGFQMMRVPARFFFITSFSFSALLGIGARSVFHASEGVLQDRRVRLGAMAFNFLIAALGIFLLLNSLETVRSAGFLMLTVSLGILLLIFIPPFPKFPRSILLGSLLVIELLVFNRSLIETRSVESMEGQASAFTESRVFSPSYSVPQDQAAKYGIQLSDGVNPIQLSAYWEFMSHAVGFDGSAYSVTLPPYPDGDPSINQNFAFDLEKMSLLNIGFVLSAYPLEVDGLEIQNRGDELYAYSLKSTRPRAWVETENGSWEMVDSVTISPNHIEITAQGPGALVLSEVIYPGWSASLDGKQVPIEPSHALLRSIRLSAGSHEIQFKFQPLSFYFGLGITLTTLVLLAGIWRRK
jgi:hypothetical protein